MPAPAFLRLRFDGNIDDQEEVVRAGGAEAILIADMDAHDRVEVLFPGPDPGHLAESEMSMIAVPSSTVVTALA